jgi:hypothetical protein
MAGSNDFPFAKRQTDSRSMRWRARWDSNQFSIQAVTNAYLEDA